MQWRSQLPVSLRSERRGRMILHGSSTETQRVKERESAVLQKMKWKKKERRTRVRRSRIVHFPKALAGEMKRATD